MGFFWCKKPERDIREDSDTVGSHGRIRQAACAAGFVLDVESGLLGEVGMVA
jgi:hypothetical protein